MKRILTALLLLGTFSLAAFAQDDDDAKYAAELFTGEEISDERAEAVLKTLQQQMENHKKRAIEALSVFHDSSLKAALIQLLEYTITRVY